MVIVIPGSLVVFVILIRFLFVLLTSPVSEAEFAMQRTYFKLAIVLLIAVAVILSLFACIALAIPYDHIVS